MAPECDNSTVNRFIALGVAFVLGSATALAAPPPSLQLEALTWMEVREAVAAGNTTVLVPIGGTEQNGPHMVLGKHNTRARVLATRIAERLGNALVAPVVAYVPEGAIDPPSAHMRFPGTVTIPEDAFEKTLESIARSYLKHGFRTVVLLGDHGGYRRSLDRVAKKVPGVRVPNEYYRELAHAGREDTALALAVDPTLIRAARAGDAPAKDSGAAGDARGATAEEGRKLADAIVEKTVAALGKGPSSR